MSNLPPPPERKDIPSDDACQAALGFWQRRVDRIQGLVWHARLNVAGRTNGDAPGRGVVHAAGCIVTVLFRHTWTYNQCGGVVTAEDRCAWWANVDRVA